MAAAYSPSAFESSTYKAIFFHRFNEIAATRRRKSAASSDQRADGNLIEADAGNGRSSGESEDRVFAEPGHWPGDSSRFNVRVKQLAVLALAGDSHGYIHQSGLYHPNG
jgi:hypothetical protein